jgi:hypothetical protein
MKEEQRKGEEKVREDREMRGEGAVGLFDCWAVSRC